MNIADERKDLVCLRKAEIRHPHPKADFTHICALCLERVGINPSGQALIASHPRGMVRIVCTQCVDLTRYEVLLHANPDLDL